MGIREILNNFVLMVTGKMNDEVVRIPMRRKKISRRAAEDARLVKIIQQMRAESDARQLYLMTLLHDFRTPLHAIMGFTACLLEGMDGPINEQQRTSLKKIEQVSLRLLYLLDDILDLAKMEANSMELSLTPVEVIALAKSCIEEIAPLAQQKNLRLSLDTEHHSLTIHMDAARFRQVILNLLANAIKFTEEGDIVVAIQKSESHAEIHVKDTGVGLEEHELEKIFEPFTQVKQAKGRLHGGSGLGLVICHRIVQLHGGHIEVRSKKGKGSTFIVRLPLKPAE